MFSVKRSDKLYIFSSVVIYVYVLNQDVDDVITILERNAHYSEDFNSQKRPLYIFPFTLGPFLLPSPLSRVYANLPSPSISEYWNFLWRKLDPYKTAKPCSHPQNLNKYS